ncbi:hypothetical protein QVD17_20893 [Tagetes erecta]|uniref:Uncharacterized protein n=1 Tax=Tagetes erecta TaxID=13708 RepID=A0AAD8KM11_TARER|nr:hypothetical protein QVD17_20893 [Tagetes erecta]
MVFLVIFADRQQEEMGMNDDEFDDEGKPSMVSGVTVSKKDKGGNEKPSVVSKNSLGDVTSPGSKRNIEDNIANDVDKDITSSGLKRNNEYIANDDDKDITSSGLKRKSEDIAVDHDDEDTTSSGLKCPGSPSKDEGKPSVVSKKEKRSIINVNDDDKDITSTGLKMVIFEDSTDEDEDTTSSGLKRNSDQADDGRIRYRCLCNGPHDDDDVYDPRAIENFIRLINPPGCQRYIYEFDSDSDDAAAA